jgi:hypothetical protein
VKDEAPPIPSATVAAATPPTTTIGSGGGGSGGGGGGDGFAASVAGRHVVVPPEPPASKEVVTVQVKFPDGRRLRRRFPGDRPVADVFHFAAAELGMAVLPPAGGLEIVAYPRKDLVPLQAVSFRDAGLNNSALTVRVP